ncbi:transcriptional regulator [Pigmentiphaga litoralis]|uniref:GntR family transcriptional regulator n=1 Tax=Pigmentiphaga litoralis TaxID=516702 RepID=UPI0019AEE27A|nr:GntR family transcriptional regulator [Pigmentiphaga litoralis]GGX22849.1 transcriptional regulator [Pigmentiphaga litoralis]
MSAGRTVKTKATSVDAPADPGAAAGTAAGGGLHDVYRRLRQSIITGELPPGAIINQVHIARMYGMSRTPVREALRMLQAENLVEAQFQHRMRVTDVTPSEVDAVYANWILVQSLGTALTVPRVTPDEVQVIKDALRAMNEHSPTRGGDPAQWSQAHSVFHRSLMQHANPVIREAIDNCWSRLERARRAYMRNAPQSWQDSEEEHIGLVAAYEAGDTDRAVYLATRQLSRIARIVISNIDPMYEVVAIREALRFVTGAAASPVVAAPLKSVRKPPARKTA